MTAILRSSRQASTIFALDGTHPPRMKNLFYVSFTRGTDVSTSSTSSLSNYTAYSGDLGFLCKSTDRPQIQPQTEELNQYNKKRIINTGIKYSPLRMVFYDTTDNLFMQMFSDYASNYFGAFGHGNNTDDYLNDVLTTYTDTAGTGWGFAPTATASTNTDANSQYYFRKISIYEVWGGYYTQTDIINPRITAFDPDGMSYEDSNIATISMTVAFEAVVYVNGGATMQMGSTSTASAASNGSAVDPSSAFASGTTGDSFFGNNDYTFAATNATSVPTYTDYKFVAGSSQATPYLLTTTYSIPQQSSVVDAYVDTATVVTDGPLANYGSYDFGAGFNDFLSSNYSTGSDLLGGAQTSSAVASALNTTSYLYAAQTAEAGVSGITTSIPAVSLASDQADVTLAAVAALGNVAQSGPNTLFYAQKIAAGAMAAATTGLPRESIFTENPKLDTTSTNSWDSSTPATNGIALSSATYEAINESRPASAQIGFNTATLKSQTG